MSKPWPGRSEMLPAGAGWRFGFSGGGCVCVREVLVLQGCLLVFEFLFIFLSVSPKEGIRRGKRQGNGHAGAHCTANTFPASAFPERTAIGSPRRLGRDRFHAHTAGSGQKRQIKKEKKGYENGRRRRLAARTCRPENGKAKLVRGRTADCICIPVKQIKRCLPVQKGI